MFRRVVCPACGAKYGLYAAQINKKVRCQRCGGIFLAVSAGAVVADAAQQQQPAAPLARTAAPPPPTLDTDDPDDLLYDLPPEPSVSQDQVYQTPSEPKVRRSAAPLSVAPWWLGTNWFEAGVTIAIVTMIAAGSIIGGAIGFAVLTILSFVMLAECIATMWLLARASGRAGYGILYWMIPFFLLAQVFGSNVDMRNASARLWRVFIFIALSIILTTRLTAYMNEMRDRPSRPIAAVVPTGSSPALLTEPAVDAPPPAGPLTKTQDVFPVRVQYGDGQVSVIGSRREGMKLIWTPTGGHNVIMLKADWNIDPNALTDIGPYHLSLPSEITQIPADSVVDQVTINDHPFTRINYHGMDWGYITFYGRNRVALFIYLGDMRLNSWITAMAHHLQPLANASGSPTGWLMRGMRSK